MIARSCLIVQAVDDRATRCAYCAHGHPRPLGARRPARRGAPLPAHGRRLLLPLRADRAVGPDAAADARLRLVPRRHVRPGAGSRPAAPSRARCAAATSRSSRTARVTSCAASPARRRPGILELEREIVSDRYEILRHGGGGAPDHADLRRGPLRPSGRPPTSSRSCRGDPPRRGLDRGTEWMQSTLRLMAAEARRLRPGGEAVITRLGDILVIQAIRVVDRDGPRRADRLARRAAGPADRARDRADPPRPRPRLDARVAGRRARDVALGVRRPLHRARRRAGDELRRALADARRARRAQGARAPPSPSWRTGSAIAPRPPSRAPSSASSGSRPGAVKRTPQMS